MVWRTDNENTLKTLPQLMEMYDKSVGRGAVLLLNNTPDRTGLIPEADARRSAEFGAEIRRQFETPVADSSGKGPEVRATFSTRATIDRAVTMEDTTHGERVRAYVLEGLVDGDWKPLATGTAIGHKRIDRFPPIEVEGIRLRVTEAVGEPIIRRLAAFRAPEPAR